MIAKNITKNSILVKNIMFADNFFLRLKGLLFRNTISDNEGLFLKNTNSIHTFFIKFKTDVIFLDKNNSIVKLVKSMKPFKIAFSIFKGQHTIEVCSGIIDKTGCEVGG